MDSCTNDDQFGDLLRFLQLNDFRVVIIEGPRGSGKTTCCTRLLERSDLLYYKTWGSEQKWIRAQMQSSFKLDLPQGCYFALDFIKQALPAISRPILMDRGNISALAYQREFTWGSNKDLRVYYVDLMKSCSACLLVMSTPVSSILERRVARGDGDEQRLHALPVHQAESIVSRDVRVYEESVDDMCTAGLDEVALFDVGGATTCTCYVPKDTELIVEAMNYVEGE